LTVLGRPDKRCPLEKIIDGYRHRVIETRSGKAAPSPRSVQTSLASRRRF
jgi:hypothetical protein